MLQSQPVLQPQQRSRSVPRVAVAERGLPRLARVVLGAPNTTKCVLLELVLRRGSTLQTCSSYVHAHRLQLAWCTGSHVSLGPTAAFSASKLLHWPLRPITSPTTSTMSGGQPTQDEAAGGHSAYQILDLSEEATERLSRPYHPDKLAGKSEDEREEAAPQGTCWLIQSCGKPT